MIPYDIMKAVIPKGLADYLGVKVVRGNQTAPAPAYPYGIYNVTTIAGANNGTWQQDDDGVDRKLVRSIWSLSFVAKTWDESVALAIKAREWIEHAGRLTLSEHGIAVQSVTDVTNRDNILTVEYERKNGFDVVFYVYDEVGNLTDTTGYIEHAELTRVITD